jgi:hypothetical protein
MNRPFNEDDDFLSASYKKALVTTTGKRIVNDLMFYVTRQSHVAGDPTSTAFKEGERALALRILRLSGELE